EEIERTILKKPRLHQVITAARLQRFLALLAVLCEEIPVIEAAIPPITRDPKDDYLIAYAVVGRADYLVSGDNDLLVLQQAGQVQIVTSAQFRQILRKGS
ncbi:MAG: putative toxin-antitoxin system toxin component, PIN family, partial [Anaerolineae bacterium]